MLVTVQTLNALGLETPRDKEDKVAALVGVHERRYLDRTLSVPLSEELQESALSDQRFVDLLSSKVDGDVRMLGLSAGANYYVYYWFLLDKYNDVNAAGTTVQTPKNATYVSPAKYLSEIYNQASEASSAAALYVSSNRETYPEATVANPIGRRSNYNF